MKYLYTLSILFLLASCQKEEKKEIDRTKTDWAFYKLDGNVINTETRSWLVNENLEKIKTQHEDMSMHDGLITFDENGMLVSERFFLNDKPFEESTYKGREHKLQTLQYINDAVGIKTDYDWDKSGKNIAITRRNPDNSQIDRIEMKYQGKNLAQKTTFNSQNLQSDKINYQYDSKGNVIQEDIYLSLDFIQYKAVYKYDKQNRKISEARYDKNSKKHYETIFKYDGKNLINKTTVNDKGEIEVSEDITYDNKGNVLSELAFEKYDNSKTLTKYAYDANNNRTEWSVEKNGAPFMQASYTYDKKGNTTLITVKDKDGKEVDSREYIFEYDKKGNWIKKTTKIKGVPQFVAERKIKYQED